MISKEEAIKQLNELIGDQESAHIEADDILLECVDPEIKKAYENIQTRLGGFWYA